jgi:hypothetical protein
MKHGLLLAACGTVLIAACSDRDETGSDNPTAPGIVAFAPLSQPPGCSFRDAQAFARDYFKVQADKRAAGQSLSAAEDAAIGSATRDNALFAVMELVAKVGGDPSLSNLPGTGASLVNEVVECGGAAWVVTDNRAFTNTVANALTDLQGGFAVVGGTTLFGDATTDHVFAESGEAAFGLNSVDPNNILPDNWSDALGRAVVVLGKLGGVVNFGLDQVVPNELVYRASLIFTGARPAAFSNDDMFAVEFYTTELTTLPAPASHRVGRNRGTGNVVLQESDIAGFPASTSGLSGSSPNIFARLLDKVVGVFRPTPLQAMMFVPPWSGSSGGQGTSAFDSDYSVVNVLAVYDSVPSIPDQVINQSFSFPITVCAVAKCGQLGAVPLENAAVTATVIGNFGTPITLSGTGCPVVQGNLSCTVYTDETGTAVFNVSLNKTGSYTFSVSTNFPPFTVGPTSTNQFIVRAN